MTGKKILAIIGIFFCTLVAWMILGGVHTWRTTESSRELSQEVRTLFGGPLDIKKPTMYYQTRHTEKTVKDGKQTMQVYYNNHYFDLKKSDIKVDIKLDPRKKGVLWFPTYRLTYKARYVYKNPSDRTWAYFRSSLESTEAVYDKISLKVNGVKVSDIQPLIKASPIGITIGQRKDVVIEYEYETTGMEKFMYYISPNYNEIEEIKDFRLVINTDFDNFDFPHATVSPGEKNKKEKGYELVWDFQNSVTGKDVGLIIPNRLNPGEIVSRVTFFAPVPLLFFFFIILIISVILRINIHPMNYFFLAASFFAFHLMFSYFADHLNIYLTFAISSVISILLVSSYLRIFTPAVFAFVYSGIAQFIYLVVFSFSFFIKGSTGLICTVCAVITLFILMQLTGRISWDEVFRKKSS